MHATCARLGTIRQTAFRKLLPLQAGLVIKYNRQQGTFTGKWGAEDAPHTPQRHSHGQLRPQTRCGDLSAGPLPLRLAPGLPAWPGSEFPQLEEDHSFSLPPNTLDISKAVPSFRSHIKSASFLLRQRDLPAKQAAGTHVFVTQRLPLKRAGVNHGGLIVSAAGPVEGIRVNADGAARPVPAHPAPAPSHISLLS